MTFPGGPPYGQPAPVPPIGRFAYWRKNPFLASSMEPIVMILVDGRFTALGAQGSPVIDAYTREISVKLTFLGTLKLVVHDRKFAIVGRGSIGGMEDAFSPAQVAILQDFCRRFPQVAMQADGNAPPNEALPGATGTSLRPWRIALAGAGASAR